MSKSTASLVKYIGKAEGGKEIIMKTFSNTFSDAKKVTVEIVDFGEGAKNYVSSTGKSINPYYGKWLDSNLLMVQKVGD